MPARCSTYLFSYGSNGPKQLAQRLGHDVEAFPAYLPGYRRVYRGWSRNWQGGPASLKRKAGAVVYGNAVCVTDRDLQVLKRYEGSGYKLIGIGALIDLGGHGNFMRHPQACVAFVSKSREWNAPSERYLKAIADNVGAFWSNASGRKPKPADFYNEE